MRRDIVRREGVRQAVSLIEGTNLFACTRALEKLETKRSEARLVAAAGTVTDPLVITIPIMRRANGGLGATFEWLTIHTSPHWLLSTVGHRLPRSMGVWAGRDGPAWGEGCDALPFWDLTD